MGFYNVINRTLIQGGQPEDVSQIVANFDAIAAVLNGGLDNSNVNAAAAIDYSKLNVPLNAITDTRVSGIVFVGADINAGAANTDVAWDGASAASELRSITTSGGTVRSIGAPTRGAGTRLQIRNGAAGTVTFKHNLAGGTGATLALIGGVDLILGSGDVVEFVYSGTTWLEASRDRLASGAIAPWILPGLVQRTGAAALAANTAYLIPLTGLVVPTNISRFAFAIGTSSGNMDLGVYYTDDELTFTRVFSTGSFATPAANNQARKAFATQTLTPVANRGWYYAFAADNAVATFEIQSNGAGATTIQNVFSKAAQFPLPATITTPGLGATLAPVIHGLL